MTRVHLADSVWSQVVAASVVLPTRVYTARPAFHSDLSMTLSCATPR